MAGIFDRFDNSPEAIRTWNRSGMDYGTPGVSRTYGLMDTYQAPGGTDDISGAPPKFGLLDMFLGPQYSRNKYLQWDYNARRNERQQQMAQIQGIMSEANPFEQARQFMMQGMPQMATQAMSLGEYPGKLAGQEQDYLINRNQELRSQQSHGLDMGLKQHELNTANSNAARNMDKEDLSRFESAVGRFEKEVQPLKVMDREVASAINLMKNETLTDAGYKYDNPSKDLALMTHLAKTLRPSEAMNQDDATLMQSAAAGSAFYAQLYRKWLGEGSLSPKQREQMMDIIVSKGQLATKTLEVYRDRAGEYYRATGGGQGGTEALNAYYRSLNEWDYED